MSAQDSQQMTLSIRPKPGQPKKKEKVNEKIEVLWESYFGPNDNNLAKWKQLCRDLGKPGETYTSKTQCRKALRGVWVNILDFLLAENKPEDVWFFKSERDLSAYTLRTRKIFPRHKVSLESPLRDLLAHIFRN
ncbi:hypothetical protein N8I77_003874 [Diaporthe amygdali]|uniref:Uncharacterized protein n=1 Tax=Phomopsis amygdali TaxID=1214568 RepID=A0AAD9SKR9_PHOAM|nr:hypothetical protein N8I77_003874 [Diaporthe amygdali]